MLNTLILQSACAGFLFHWIVSDALYWKDNPLTEKIMYFLFMVNLLGIAYGHIVISRVAKIDLALVSLDPPEGQ